MITQFSQSKNLAGLVSVPAPPSDAPCGLPPPSQLQHGCHLLQIPASLSTSSPEATCYDQKVEAAVTHWVGVQIQHSHHRDELLCAGTQQNLKQLSAGNRNLHTRGQKHMASRRCWELSCCIPSSKETKEWILHFDLCWPPA